MKSESSNKLHWAEFSLVQAEPKLQAALQELADALQVLLKFDGIAARELARAALEKAKPFLKEG